MEASKLVLVCAGLSGTAFGCGFILGRIHSPDLENSKRDALEYFITHVRWSGSAEKGNLSFRAPLETCRFSTGDGQPHCERVSSSEILHAPSDRDNGDDLVRLETYMAGPISGGMALLIKSADLAGAKKSDFVWLALGAFSGYGLGYRTGIHHPQDGKALRAIIESETETETWKGHDDSMRRTYAIAQRALCARQQVPRSVMAVVYEFPDLQTALGVQVSKGLTVQTSALGISFLCPQQRSLLPLAPLTTAPSVLH